VRIAFSGSHRTGKSTLVERVAERLTSHPVIDEPYHLLADEGHDFSDPPSLEDFQAQLERAVLALEEAGPDALFDRCPADPLAYLMVHDDAGALDDEEWMERAAAAMATLDLLVFVPVEADDRVPLAAHEDAAQRLAVDGKLRELLLDGALGIELEVLAVHGTVAARAEQVLARVAPRRRP
jgi:hypothetical protein